MAMMTINVNNRVPTHYCRVCGALWFKGEDHWSLVSLHCGKCCDNALMGNQIVAFEDPTGPEPGCQDCARDGRFLCDTHGPEPAIPVVTESLSVAPDRQAAERFVEESLIPAAQGQSVERRAPELPSAASFASAVWRDWMTNEQADKLGAELHQWLTAHLASATPPAPQGLAEGEDSGDPHEFGCGIEPNPKARYWQGRADFWRQQAVSLGYHAPDDTTQPQPVTREDGSEVVKRLMDCQPLASIGKGDRLYQILMSAGLPFESIPGELEAVLSQAPNGQCSSRDSCPWRRPIDAREGSNCPYCKHG